jgi:hypothetical protein
MYINNGWDLTFSESHWSTLETSKRFFHKILLPYLHSQIEQLGLLEHHKMVWLLNCWFVHKSKEFLNYMKKDHPNIMVIFILVNCISELQLADVILQWPLKHAYKVEFNTWTTLVIKEHINNGQEPCVDFKMNNLKPRMCSWLHATRMKVKEVRNMIVKWWDKTIITRAFGIEFQLVALKANTTISLFIIIQGKWKNIWM